MTMYRLLGQQRGYNINYIENITNTVKVAASNPVYQVRGYNLGLHTIPGIFSCCGLVGIAGISYPQLITWDEKTNLLKLLVDTYGNDPGHLIYVLEKHQLETPLHKLLVEVGAKQMGDTFRNLRYDDHHLSIWLVNIKDRSKMYKYLDDYGRAKPDPAKAAKTAAATAAKTAGAKVPPAPVGITF